MSIEIKVPEFPESVAEGSVASWLIKEGEAVEEGQIVAEIETDKVVMEVPATSSGVLVKTHKNEGDTVVGQEVIGLIDEKAQAAPKLADQAPSESQEKDQPSDQAQEVSNKDADDKVMSPSVRRMVAENNIDPNTITGSGKGGRIIQEDVTKAIKAQSKQQASSAPVSDSQVLSQGARVEKRVPMTRLRQTIAKRLVSVQHESAILTTFNEVDMKQVMDLRKEYKERFEKTHETRLGFMSFFVKATVEALKRFPAVNASIDGNDMVYHGYFDIGVAVSSPRGLVVPVLRDADQLSFAETESTIKDYAIKARDGKLSLDALQGGTFTITNGGVFGSMLSTPIINQPQSAILGMHNIVERPVVVDGQIVIRPIMYLALSYDHRIIDGSESVQFLRTIKEMIEDPARLLLQV